MYYDQTQLAKDITKIVKVFGETKPIGCYSIMCYRAGKYEFRLYFMSHPVIIVDDTEICPSTVKTNSSIGIFLMSKAMEAEEHIRYYLEKGTSNEMV